MEYNYFKKYNQLNRERISLNLGKEKDKDIIEAVEKVGEGNKQAGVKALIRDGMKYRGLA